MYPFELSGWAFGENLDEEYDLEKLKEENQRLQMSIVKLETEKKNQKK